jgi:hypothetical protein
MAGGWQHPRQSDEQINSLAVEASDTSCVATLINGGIGVISPAGFPDHLVDAGSLRRHFLLCRRGP